MRRLVVLWIAFCVAGWAQTTRSTIVGSVSDSSGAMVSGAAVSAVEKNTGIASRTQTAAEGQYILTNLEPGTYDITVTVPGFQTSTVRDVTLQVNQTARVDVGLKVGEVTNRIEVEAVAPLVQSETSSVSSVVDGRQIAAMPLNGRGNLNSLMSLAPGVQRATTNPLVSGGSWVGSTNMMVDGSANVDTGNERLSDVMPSLEAVAEFRLIGNGASAEFGRGGAQVVVATKAGSNEFHGSLLAFNRNGALAARNFFAQTKPPFNRNEYGGSLGGPVKRNALFFFGSFEGLRRVESQTSIMAMPTDALRQGDFSRVTGAIKDSLNNGLPFQGNRIPASRIHSISQEFLKYASEPNLPGTGTAGLGNNYVVNSPTRETNDRYSIRSDYQVTPSDRITGRYFRAANGPYLGSAGGGTERMGNWNGLGTATHNATASYTRVLSPRHINEVRFGFFHLNFFRIPQSPDLDLSPLIPGLTPPVKGIGGLPTVTITGFRGFSDQPGSYDRNRSYEAIDSFSWTHGKHNVKAGFEYERASARQSQNSAPARGSFGFDGRYSGNAFADFLLGTLASTGRINRGTVTEPVNNRYGTYIQDDWNALPRLTLNLGLRYEYASPLINHQGEMANFYPALGKMVLLKGTPDARLMSALGVVDGKSAGITLDNYMNRDRNNFAPRVGFAFRPLGNARFVLRGSYGIFYNVISVNNGNYQLALNPPFRASETFEPAPGSTPSLTWSAPFPGQGNIPVNPQIWVVATNRRNGYAQQWNFTIEKQIFNNTALRASYLGNHGTHLQRNLAINEPAPSPGAVQPKRPYQPWGPINYYDSGRDSVTQQMQLSAQRRYSTGLTFEVEYQYTNGLGPDVTGVVGATDPRNARLDRGHLDFIAHHLATTNYVYELPFGRNRFRRLLGGWRLAGIVSIASGLPFSVNFTSNVQGWPSSRADVAGGSLYPSDKSIARWFNPAAFKVPAQFTYGNSARNLLFGPGAFGWDQAVFKDVNITERIHLNIRAEAFNLPNHASFGQPAANISVPSTVGTISSAGAPRAVQFGARVSF